MLHNFHKVIPAGAATKNFQEVYFTLPLPSPSLQITNRSYSEFIGGRPSNKVNDV